MSSALAPRKGGSFSTDRVEALLALLRARLAGGSGPNPAGSPVFIFRPGGVAGGNVYTTFSSMHAATLLVQGPKWIELDSTFAPIVIPTTGMPAAGWNFNDWTIVGIPNLSSLVTFAAGAKIDGTKTNTWHVTTNLELVNSGTVVWTPTAAAGGTPCVYVEQDGFIVGTPAAPFLEISAGITVEAFIINQGLVGDGVSSAILIDAGGTLSATVAGGGQIAAHAVSGAGAYELSSSPGGLLQQPQTLEPTLYFYIFPPQIIDETNAAPIGPAAIVSFTSTGTVQKSSSGRARVGGSISATASAGSAPGTVVTFTLFRNPGGVIIATQHVGLDAAQGVQCTLTKIDTLPDFAAHTYGIQANIGGAGPTLTIAAGFATINVDELT